MRALDTFNPIYSIIVPVYNAEKYLDHCIESVLAQNSASEFELILVNDGSRDGSAAICDRYAEINSHIHVIHQKNQGVSAARNAGIAAAKGQYVLFLDSDDIWPDKMLETVECYLDTKPDIIEFGCCYFGDEGIQKTDIPACMCDGKSGTEYIAIHEKAGVMINASACMRAFRRTFLVDNQLEFPLGISYGEDFYFCMQCLKYAQSIYTIPEILYWYRMNQTSATHAPTLKSIRDVLSVSIEIYRLFPISLFADYYCMRIWRLERLSRADADKLKKLLQDNRDILQHVSGWQARIARGLYFLFGWYNGAKLLRVLTNVRNFIKRVR